MVYDDMLIDKNKLKAIKQMTSQTDGRRPGVISWKNDLFD